MILRQFLHAEPTAASYFLGCVGKAAGLVVDPLFPIDPYLEAAASAGTPIHLVIDTHLHADHRSAGRALAEAAGAAYALHASSNVGYDHRPLHDGERIELGNVALEVFHTPGHTPEHLCLLVTDRTRAEDPWCLLGGHTLMVGDVGRTELAVDAATGARDLFASLAQLKALPDHVEILPGALAGSVCGRGLSGKRGSTIGFERRHNPAFRIDDPDSFVAFTLENIPPAPPQAVALRAWNAGFAPKHAA
jgi:glyoxylase-like metal-dependent hydrolase (beta-lactamase superfamily II)